MTYRTLEPDQTARVHLHDTRTGEDVVIHESDDVLYEAPNWSLDGTRLLLNGNGVLWSLAPEAGARPQEIVHPGLPALNNDHVLDPSGEAIYVSAMDRHIYRTPLSGGAAQRVTSDEDVWHFLHGVSPDGERLAYVRITTFDEPGRLAVMPATGGKTTVLDTGAGHIDGPEWSPDGEWIYLNSEHWAARPGHAQLARIRETGGELERLVVSDTVDWFPHLSPDGTRAVYIEFPPGTEGHPADLDVRLVVVDTADWQTPLERIPLTGGQGTINVNSWSPDSRRFAYVSYPSAASLR